MESSDRNAHIRLYEFGCRRTYYIVFIEVRYRNQTNYGSSLETIHYRKQVKLIRTAEYYLLTQSLTFSHARFDVVAIDAIANEHQLKIHWLKNVIELK